jgi:hypothetical protein
MGGPDESIRRIPETRSRVRANGKIRPRSPGQGRLEAHGGEMAKLREKIQQRSRSSSRSTLSKAIPNAGIGSDSVKARSGKER